MTGRSRADGVGEILDLRAREQRALKGRQIVEHTLRGDALDLRVIHECAERLFLQRTDPRVKLVAAEDIRPTRPWIAAARSAECHVQHRRHAAPDVDRGVGRRLVGRGIDQPDVGRQRKDDADEAVLPQVAVVAGPIAIDQEVVGINRPEQRIIGFWIEDAQQLEQPVAELDVRRRELEGTRRHVAVGAGSPVPAEPRRSAVQKREQPASRPRRTVRRHTGAPGDWTLKRPVRPRPARRGAHRW